MLRNWKPSDARSFGMVVMVFAGMIVFGGLNYIAGRSAGISLQQRRDARHVAELTDTVNQLGRDVEHSLSRMRIAEDLYRELAAEQEKPPMELAEAIDGGFGAGVERSGKWPKVQHDFKAAHPNCCVCGKPATQVHHLKPFHIDPALELDPENLASVCDWCHLKLAHLGNYKNENKNFAKHAAMLWKAKLEAEAERKEREAAPKTKQGA